jgi:autotransporter passenger strand-loop-strand repeat protein
MASGVIVSSGGLEYVFGTAIGTTLTGGSEVVSSGGTGSGIFVSSGGLEYVFGTASSTTVSSGGSEHVEAGGTASATVISGGGQELVLSGGVDRFSVVSNGGLEFISSAGVVSGGTVISGANITVGAGGNVLDGLTISGGTAVVSGSMAAGQTLTFAGTGGDLALHNLPDFAAVIGGFGTGDTIDLGGFAYGSGETRSFAEAASTTSGTLKVVDGGSQARLTLLGSYVTGDFALSSDSAGGTFVKFT